MSKFYTTGLALFLTVLLSGTAVFSAAAKSESSRTDSFFSLLTQKIHSVVLQNFPEEVAQLSDTDYAAAPAVFMTECTGTSGVLGGTAFGDFNYDGVEDAGTVGIPNMKVYIFSCDVNGASVIADSTLTDEFGHYTFTGLTDGDQYRVEFHQEPFLEALKDYTEGGYSAISNHTATKQVTVPSCDIDAGFAFSKDFYGENPFMAATCFVNGNPISPTPPADDANNPAFEKTVVWFNWDSSGSTDEPSELANAGETGSVYGLAYNRFTEKIYTSAFIKRHTGLGTLGLGGIYEIDVTDINNPVAAPFLDVTTLGINVGNVDDNVARGLPDGINEPSNDASVYGKIAKEGIGAIDLDEDTNTLYFTNLFDKTVYGIALDSDNNPATAPTAADLTTFPLPADPCTNGEFRPFAVHVHRGELYIGGTCDGSAGGTEADLEAYVYRHNGTNFEPIATADLSYVKGYAARENQCINSPGWYPWTDAVPASCSGTGSGSETIVYPTPVLSDLKFDVDGSLVLGFMDRTGHQIGYRNYGLTGTSPLLSNVSGGDLLRLHNTGNGYVQEVNGMAGDIVTAGAGNNQGNGGGEYYFMDLFAGPSDNIPFPPHIETSQGDLAHFPGAGFVATTSLDPWSTLFNSGGINWMNNETGDIRGDGYVLYRSSTSDISTFSKGNGLGGLITLGEVAPLSAGGLAWIDSNTDGIQDGCEPVLPGINVSLFTADGTLQASTITDANGLYAFGAADLAANTEYFVVFGQGGQFDPTDGSLNDNLFITVANTGMWTDPDRNDSDAVMTPAGTANDAFTVFPSINFTTGGDGFVTNDLDAGFTPDNLNPIAGIGGSIFTDADGDGIQDGAGNGEGGIEGVTVTLLDDNGNVVQTVETDADGNYFFPNVPPGTYTVNVDETSADNGLAYEFSPQDQGNDDTVDSDVNPANGNSDPIVFDPAGGDLDVDAGLTAPVGSISGFVFNDLDTDGIQDAGEVGIGNVTVLLYADGGNVPLQTVVTDDNGNYTFSNVEAGSYFLDFDATTNNDMLTGLSGSPMDAGNDDTVDSDADANAGETDVFAFDPAVNPTADFDAGFFQPTGTISGSVFLDNNGDGTQDGGDDDLGMVTVILTDSDGNVVQTVMTDADGNYVFTGVLAGDYTISFDTGNPELNVTGQNQGNDDSIDSDINSDGTLTITGFDPANPVDIDAGFTQATTSISGLVFSDMNENGIQDGGEQTVANVDVILLDDQGDVVATVQTNNNGVYIFANVPTGDYTVIFNPAAAGINDFEYTTQDVGNNDAVDSDVDANGTVAITVDAQNGTPITDVNAGLILAGGTVTGFVWKECPDDGIFTAGEELLSGITVRIEGNNTAGTPVETEVQTDVNGIFTFESVPAGTYELIFSYPDDLEGVEFTQRDQGDNEAFDSDAEALWGDTDEFTLAPGQVFNDFSAGFTDIQAPEFVNPPADEDVSCGDPDFGNPPTLTATDNCDTDVEITFEENMDTATGDCSGMTITRTWTATDDCGNQTTFTQTLNATDNTPPVITLINPELAGLTDGDTLFFDCNETIPVYTADDAEATDTCDPDPELTFEDFLITDGDCAENGFLQQMYCGWIATDNCGNSDTFDIYLIIQDIEAPVLIGDIPNDITIECDDEIPAAPVVTATDNCTEDIEVEFVETMIGDTCDLVKITRKYTAIDDCGNMTMDQYNIFIETPELEIIGVPEDITIDCADLTDAPEVTLSHECHNPILTFNEVINGDTCAEYKIIRIWTASNDCGQTATEQYTITVQTPPLEITGVPSDITVDCDNVPDPAEPTVDDACFEVDLDFNETVLNTICETYIIVRTWTATDACGNVVSETQNITVEVEELGLTGIPADITIDCTQPIPPVADPQPTSDCYDVEIDFGETVVGDTCSDYKILRVWVANDFCGNQIMEMQTILVEVPDLELTNLAPDLTLECDETIPAPMDPTPMSDCYDTELEFAETITPGDCPEEFTITRNWSATDDCGNVLTHEQTITVIDTVGPVITVDHPDLAGVPSGSTLTYDCSELMNLADAPATAEDNCADGPLDVEFMEMNEFGDCEEDGFIIRMECCWKAEDPCGNQAEYCVTVIITDSQAPVLTGVPADITINLAEGDTVPEPADVTVEDACSDPELIFTETSEALDCGYILTRTWFAEDDCGNTVFQSQIITVNDICDCPDIVVTDVTITEANCNQNNGSISVITELSVNIYDFILLPNFGNANDAGNVVTDLPPGSYLMIVNLPGVEDCDEKIYFDIVAAGCSDELQVNIADGATEYCIDESVLDFEGNITSATLCNAGNANTVSASELNENCLTLTAADGFEGLSPDQICVVTCFNGSTTDCDTTYLNVNVTPVDVPCALGIQDIAVADDFCGLSLGSINFSVVGGEGPLEFVWSDDVSQNNIATGLTAGSYSVTVNDAGTGCSTETAFTVGESQLPPLENDAVTITDVSCAGEGNGQIQSNTSEEYTVFNTSNIQIGTTPLSGLPAGNYIVAQITGNCTANLSVVINDGAEVIITPTVSNETCTTGDGSISLEIDGGAAPYTYFWSPNVSDADFADNLPAGNYDVTVMDAGGCTAVAEGITVELDCDDCNLQYSETIVNLTCDDATDGSIEITAQQTYNYAWSHDANLTAGAAMNLGAGSYTVTISEIDGTCTEIETYVLTAPAAVSVAETITNETCAENDGSIALQISGGTAPYGVVWSDGNSDETRNDLTAGTYAATVTDAAGCTAAVSYTVADDCDPVNCTDFIQTSEDFAGTDNCDDPIGYCLDVPITDVFGWDITLNGAEYTQSLSGCDFDTIYTYDYSVLPGGGEDGPYSVVWTVNGTENTGTFGNPIMLLMFMNDTDPVGNWFLNADEETLTGGRTFVDYGDMVITQTSTGSPSTLAVSETATPNGTQLLVAEGENELIFTQPNGCTDTVNVTGLCLTTETVEVTVNQGEGGTYCADTSELPGESFNIEYNCTVCDNTAIGLDSEGCFTYTGAVAGQDVIEVVACDEFGVCDVTFLVINVTDQSPGEGAVPIINEDFFETEVNIPVLLKVADNDVILGDITDFGIQRTPENAYVDINFDNTILYTPVEDYCGDDVLTYFVCNETDCGSARVRVRVHCEAPQPVSGFSPNGDENNEFFTVKGLEQFPDNGISIYDRRGILVYETTNYKNNWRGKWRGNDLPDGTYFYVLRYDGGKRVTGYVQIMR